MIKVENIYSGISGVLNIANKQYIYISKYLFI